MCAGKGRTNSRATRARGFGGYQARTATSRLTKLVRPEAFRAAPHSRFPFHRPVTRPGDQTHAVRCCHTVYDCRMTMLSFRVEAQEAEEARRWADVLGVDRSELLREALRRHLDRLASEQDGNRWTDQPLEQGEKALAEIADWGPAEDWADWGVDATR